MRKACRFRDSSTCPCHPPRTMPSRHALLSRHACPEKTTPDTLRKGPSSKLPLFANAPIYGIKRQREKTRIFIETSFLQERDKIPPAFQTDDLHARAARLPPLEAPATASGPGPLAPFAQPSRTPPVRPPRTATETKDIATKDTTDLIKKTPHPPRHLRYGRSPPARCIPRTALPLPRYAIKNSGHPERWPEQYPRVEDQLYPNDLEAAYVTRSAFALRSSCFTSVMIPILV